VRGRTAGFARQLTGTAWGWAAATAAACVFTGVGAAWIAVAGGKTPSLALWLVVCALAASGLGAAAFRRRAAREDLLRLAEQVMLELDGQFRSLELEQRQIERLQAAITDDDLRRQVEERLGGSAQPALLALIGQLVQAEEAVPDAAAVTKSWISRARNLASRTQFKLDQVREDVGGR
jgi:hypothetical protein